MLVRSAPKILPKGRWPVALRFMRRSNPSERMKQMTDKGKKSTPALSCMQLPSKGKAYVMGLAMTDTPASLGTDRLKFAAQQRASVMAQQPAGRAADVHRGLRPKW
jgi:hypothetical protein